MTMEAKIGHYFKRLTMIENTFGDSDYHLRRVSERAGWCSVISTVIAERSPAIQTACRTNLED